MTTYNTYHEAKIANPESNIYIHTGEFWCEKSIRPSPWTYELRGFKLCNPADYCMTVERFLSSGHKFVKSDVVFDFGDVVSIDTEFDVETYNKTDKMDDRRYILRAAALEEKTEGDFWAGLESSINEEKPRTKVEYVKCNNLQDSLDKFESMSGFEFYLDGDGSGDRINSVRRLALAYGNNSLYRRIETPMTERDELLEALQSVWIIDGVDSKEQLERIVDSELVKLVN